MEFKSLIVEFEFNRFEFAFIVPGLAFGVVVSESDDAELESDDPEFKFACAELRFGAIEFEFDAFELEFGFIELEFHAS